MKSIGIRELRNSPGAARKTLDSGEDMLLTSNGRPVALMMAVNSATLEETMQAVRRARGQTALRALRKSVHNKDLVKLSDWQIDRLVNDTRRERASRKTGAAR